MSHRFPGQSKRNRAALGALLLVLLLCLTACTGGEAAGADEHNYEANKTRSVEADRSEGPWENDFRLGLHTSYIGLDSAWADGGLLYHTLIVTGDAIGERQVYSVRELEELALLSLKNEAMNKLALAQVLKAELPQGAADLAGLDFARFLALCGAEGEGTGVDIYTDDSEKPALSLSLSLGDLAEGEALLAFGVQGGAPLVEDTASPGYDEAFANTEGPLLLVLPDGETVARPTKIIIGEGSDPHYEMHDRDPYQESLEIALTVNVYRGAAKTADTTRFTTAELEQAARSHPEAARGGYYGTIGDTGSYEAMGLGGWLDYFEGVDLLWLWQEEMGLTLKGGNAEFYGRDDDLFAEIEDLAYFQSPLGDEAYTVLTKEEILIPGATPMIAFAKNGWPLLAEHDHEHEGYLNYNTFNRALEEAGVLCEVGVVKNHNGPLIACLGNLEGYYGGYHIETGGDCIRIDLYLDA